MENVSPGNKLISQKHFSISAIIGGPLMAGAIVGHNLWKVNRRWKAIVLILAGLVLTLLLEFSLALFARFVLSPLLIPITFWIKLATVFLFQLLFVYFISLLLKIKTLKTDIFPENASYYGKSQIIPLTLLSFVYLLVHIDIPMLFAHFPNMILLFYVFPHIYFYTLTKHVFSSPKQILVARWVVVVIACYMPLVFALNDLLPDDIMNVPMFLAEYYIYTLLYLFLLVRGVDLLARLILKFRLGPITFIKKPITKIATLIIIFIGLIFILYAGNKRYNRIVENEFSIQVSAKDAEIDSLTICFVADMHLNNFTSKQFIDDYIEHVLQINPDIILYGGDMLESGRVSEESLDKIDQKLKALKPVYGKYIVGGNHDNFNRKGNDEASDLFFLSDTVIKVANSFYLMGLRYRSSSNKPIHDLKQSCTENLPVFLLDHSPYQLEAAYTNDINIQFSGHTHYGQVWPLNYIIELMYELPWGYEKIEDTHFFVTSGVQGWGTPIRTAGRSEIMVIHVGFVD